MDTSTPLYGFLQFLGSIPIFVIVYVAWAWLTSGGNGANVPPEQGDGIIRSDADGHPEYAVNRAAEIVYQRETGAVKWYPGAGPEQHLYANLPTDQSGGHSQRRHMEYMLEGGRAKRNGVIIHLTSVEEQDRISAARTYQSAWVNPPEKGFDPESGMIDGAIRVEHSGGNGLALVMAIIVVAVLGVGGIVCAIMLMMR